jgi:TetR/AcrR family transcriptional repressor of nem operon
MTFGRPLEFDPEIAVEAAMRLFWRKGYESSSLQDLLGAMGLSKSSFYQTFKSKHALFQRCIRHYRQTLTSEMQEQLKSVGSGRDFITTQFRSVAKETSGVDARRGCLLMNTASEFAQTDPQIAELVSYSIESVTEVFESAVQQAQQQGDIPSTKDARALATYLVSSMSGLRNMVKAGADRGTVKRITDFVLAALD